MTRTDIGWQILIFGIATLALFLAGSFGHAQTHQHGWYDGQCCNRNDCAQTTLGEVERRNSGWFVVPTKELIPFDDERVKRSLDPLIHRCIFQGPMSDYRGTGPKRRGDTRCLYVPEISG